MSDTPDAPVVVDDVTYIYRTDVAERRVLDNVSMRIEPGEIGQFRNRHASGSAIDDDACRPGLVMEEHVDHGVCKSWVGHARRGN